jgi:hypothetical protein
LSSTGLLLDGNKQKFHLNTSGISREIAKWPQPLPSCNCGLLGASLASYWFPYSSIFFPFFIEDSTFGWSRRYEEACEASLSFATAIFWY